MRSVKESYVQTEATGVFYTGVHHVPASVWVWPNFTPQEMACKGTGRLYLVPSFMDRLQWLRCRLDRPLKVNSAFRSNTHDRAVGGSGNHPTGRAVDIAIFGEDALTLVLFAEEAGFTGIGIKQHGPIERRFVHLDDLTDTDTRGPRPWLWSYS